MRRATRTVMAAALVAGIWALGTADKAAAFDPAPVSCAGISMIPTDAFLGADAHGDAVLITSSGLMIRCDGAGVIALSETGGSTMPSASASTFVAPVGSQQSWSLVQQAFLTTSNDALLGYLGSNADMTVVFWRSSVGGPIETWTFEGFAITP